MHKIVEAAIAEAMFVCSHMESKVALLVAWAEASMAEVVSALSECVWETIADTEARTLHVVGTVAQWLEKEIKAAVVSGVAMSERNTCSAVDNLCEEIRAHLAQNRADFKCTQEEKMQTVA